MTRTLKNAHLQNLYQVSVILISPDFRIFRIAEFYALLPVSDILSFHFIILALV